MRLVVRIILWSSVIAYEMTGILGMEITTEMAIGFVGYCVLLAGLEIRSAIISVNKKDE